MLSVSQVSPSKITRPKSGPAFDFVEQAIRDGQAFELSTGGYFVVAPENSLVPRFVVALQLPELANLQLYRDVIFEMNQRSSGQMWFDTSDLHAVDLVWRARLRVRMGSLLLEAPTEGERPKVENAAVRRAEETQLPEAVRMLTALPVHQGGQTPEAVREHLNNNRLYVLEVGGRVVGAATILRTSSTHASLTMVLDENHRNQGLGRFFAGELAHHATRDGVTLVAGMSNENGQSFRASLHFGMRLATIGWIAELGQL
jgi:GNAT superfamily N-acetyltransferase